MIKISVLIANKHSTSISLEEEFYTELLTISSAQNLSLNQLVTLIDTNRTSPNLSSAVRLYILNYYKEKSAAPK